MPRVRALRNIQNEHLAKLTPLERCQLDNDRLRRRLAEIQNELSWTKNPDTAGGAFRQDEIDRARNGGW